MCAYRRRLELRAFTVLELLVVIAVIMVLAAIAIPAMQAVKISGQRAACLANLRQIGAGIGLYAADNDGNIPYGPVAGAFSSPSNFYPSTGAPTSLISLRNGSPVALGLILKYLNNPKVLFCPGSDQPIDAGQELAKVGHEQAQSSYYYRHGGNTSVIDNPNAPPKVAQIKLGSLGTNRKGDPIRALVVDTVFLASKGLGQFDIVTRTHHGGKFANVLYADGHTKSFDNADSRFTVDLRRSSNIRGAFGVILGVLEEADKEP